MNIENDLKVLLSTQSRADGSSKCSLRNSESVAGLFGPLETKNTSVTSIQGTLEISYKAHGTSSSAQEDLDFSILLRESIVMCLKTYPRTTISLSVRVLADDGAGFTTAVIAAVGALIDAGIPMIKIPIGVELAIAEDSSIMFDPLPNDRVNAKARLFLIFNGADDEGPSGWLSNGRCSGEELVNVITTARAHTSSIRENFLDAVRTHVAKDRDLCI
jgi:ribonuclease PH